MELSVGIEAINFYGGPACINVQDIFKARGLNYDRFDNLMMDYKSVGLPCEDPVTNAVNAAKPIINLLNENEKKSIEMIITASESGIDLAKSLSTYIHEYLEIHRNCRLFEIKQACYGGTAALNMALCYIASHPNKDAKVLVIATDVARATLRMSYAETSQSTGAVAMLISNKPDVLEIDFGANGFYSYEVMDTFRPTADIEMGDPDVAMLSYLDCLENCYNHYSNKVENADFLNTFDFILYHVPFAGMVKGAHRRMLRQMYKYNGKEAEEDFKMRVEPSLAYSVQVGNVYSASLYLSLCGLIDHVKLNEFVRVGMFSYGSGCSSEFFSGIIPKHAKDMLMKVRIGENLDRRYRLSIDEYEKINVLNLKCLSNINNTVMIRSDYEDIYRHFFEGKDLLILNRIEDYHRKYIWS